MQATTSAGDKRSNLDQPSSEVGESLLWAALVAGLVACGIPLINGLATGWRRDTALVYTILTTIYLLLTQIRALRIPFLGWLCRLPVFLAVTGGVAFLLQSLSGDPFVQPIAFTVPLVHAALAYSAGRTALVGALYLGLTALGLWLSGERAPQAILFPVASYGALMVFMSNFVRMSVSQTAARRQADELAAAMAGQRDYLRRLAEITATLTRDLDLVPVLEKVAAEGRVLAQAGQARVWLSSTGPDGQPTLQLAAVVPPPGASPTTGSDASAAPEVGGPADASLVLPLAARGARIGLLEFRDGAPFLPDAARALQPFADAAAVAIENARLYEQAHLSATLAERNRLARELHDTIAQGLTAVTMQLEAAQRSFDRDPARAKTRLTRAHELARTTLDDVRRSVWTLASPLIDGQALSEALAETVDDFTARTGIQATYDGTAATPKLDHAATTQILRIVQEALQNVHKHAAATRVQVSLKTIEAGLSVTVEDNGRGFVPDHFQAPGDTGAGFGLHSLHERARLVGGAVEITSAPGIGARVVVTIPSVKRNA